MEALTDGIFAIAMTLLVLELKVSDLPRRVDTRELLQKIPLSGDLAGLRTFLEFSNLWIFHGITQRTAKTTRSSYQADTRARANQTGRGTVHVRPPPILSKEKCRNLQVMRFVREQIASVLQQWPEIFKAAFQGINKIHIKKSQNAFALKVWQGLIKIAHIEIAGADIAKLRNIAFYLGQSSAPGAFFIRMNFLHTHKNMPLISIRRLGQAGERIKNFKFAVAKFAYQRKIRGTAAFKRSTLHHTAFNLRWDLQNFSGHQEMFQKMRCRCNFLAITSHPQYKPELGPKTNSVVLACLSTEILCEDNGSAQNSHEFIQ